MPFRLEDVLAFGEDPRFHLRVNRLDAHDLFVIEIKLSLEIEKMPGPGKAVQFGGSRKAHTFAVVQLAHLVMGEGGEFGALGMGVRGRGVGVLR
ncbi:MAG: hypothetical protein ERJ67_08285 [Aphanocapsa feldmannii 277cV]|uniref:Uncharacterized protein n=1 Tax=Aphanocapsa feldmannii 277cV TaxID=2507553 RepID=A0A524RM26_9CHRO|nr:MAG: hypothetical protein ERJ67_08285 [Aphanocapsa feldmannii 277cV]